MEPMDQNVDIYKYHELNKCFQSIFKGKSRSQLNCLTIGYLCQQTDDE